MGVERDGDDFELAFVYRSRRADVRGDVLRRVRGREMRRARPVRSLTGESALAPNARGRRGCGERPADAEVAERFSLAARRRRTSAR